MTDVTRILNAIEQGDPNAADELLPLVYEELRLLAARKISKELPGQTLQSTALVHEAYIRLVEGEHQEWKGRAYFFKAAAEAMRRILVENARRKQRLKHGGELHRVELYETDCIVNNLSEEIISLDEAIEKLSKNDKLKAELVKLRFFAGLSMEQVAEMLDISITTAERYWAYSRSWLHLEITKDLETREKTSTESD
jgi:RNA polymerase sigma factor (TIGR02999 family)